MYAYCLNNPVNRIDYHGNFAAFFDGLSDILNDPTGSLKSDWAGRKILSHWLFGGGDAIEAEEGRWGRYMRKNDILNSQIDSIVAEYASDLLAGESISIDLTTSAVIENGEDIVGYQYLHGTNADVGGFQVSGIIYMDDTSTIHYNLKCTWNDMIDPNYEYTSDTNKAAFAQSIPFANPTDYRISITWSVSK